MIQKLIKSKKLKPKPIKLRVPCRDVPYRIFIPEIFVREKNPFFAVWKSAKKPLFFCCLKKGQFSTFNSSAVMWPQSVSRQMTQLSSDISVSSTRASDGWSSHWLTTPCNTDANEIFNNDEKPEVYFPTKHNLSNLQPHNQPRKSKMTTNK